MATLKKTRKRKPGLGHKAAKEMLMLTLISFVPRNLIETEFRFHPPRRWRWDYCVPSLMLAIEYHGGIYSGGRHVRGIGFEKDREKMNTGQLDGWTILELTEEMVKSGKAYEMIEKAIQKNGGEI